MKKVKVVILGATGAVGQRFVQLLENHPWFEVVALCASERSAGQKYVDVVDWRISSNIPKYGRNMKVGLCDVGVDAKVAFGGLDATVAGQIEGNFRDAGYAVFSNSKNYRMDENVPLVIPEVNADHIALVKKQKQKGFIVTNPNCTTIGLAMVLAPIERAFGIKQVMVTTMQALSGAGYPGVASMDIVDNIIPFIGGEEEKVETEPLKILGKMVGGKVRFSKMKISADCNRVSVRDGHMESVTIELVKKVSVEKVVEALVNFKGEPQRLKLPSAPQSPIIYKGEATRPQPILDRDLGNGMSVVVGQVRKSNVLDIKLTLLVHNTIRGAAGAAILNAELLKAKGYI